MSAAFDILVPAQRAAVEAALGTAFGRTAADSITLLTGGASAVAFRVELRNHVYLLRVEGPPSPLRNPHQYASMRIAEEAGIAPKIHYVDEARGVTILDFIAHYPLSAFPGGPPALMQALGALLQRLQDTSVFPHFIEYPDIVGRLFAHVRRTGLFAAGLLDRHVERLEEIQGAYNAGKTRLVSSHNDSNPRNILFDGKRLWLIDWESAYRNDPLVDLAVMADSLAHSPELEEALLNAWLGRAPDEVMRERFSVVRALTRLYFAGVFLSASAAASWQMADDDLSAPTLNAFRQAIQAGVLKPGVPETKHVLGKMYLASFYSGGAVPGFDAAV